LTELPCSCRKW